MPLVRERIAAVRQIREPLAKSKATRRYWQIFLQSRVWIVIPTAPFLVVPEVSSERRELHPYCVAGAAGDSEQ